MVDKTRETPQTEVDKMTEMITRDLQGLVKALYAEADMCEALDITKPAALLREAAAVIQPEANAQTMDMFAEVASAGHLAEELDNLRMSLHQLADEFDWIEELSGDSCAATLRKIAGDHKPHRKLPILPPDKAERVHAIVNAGHFPGMSEAFDAHMGAACWTDPAYAPDASMWAAAWKASYHRAADGFRAQAARDTADIRMQFKAASNEPLTLDQIAALEAGCGHQSVDWDARVSLVRAAEAAHGIGA